MSDNTRKEPIGDEELDQISGGAGGDSKSTKNYACPYCTEIFSSKKKRDVHVEKLHSKIQ